jgi:hypothetical protein
MVSNKTVDQLNKNIEEECKLITPKTLRNTRKGWEMRMKHCIAIDGEQFEHLI